MRSWAKGLMAGALLVFATGAVWLSSDRQPVSGTHTVHPVKTDEVLQNPFIGLAPPALNGPYRQPHRLVYLVLTWSELEPEPRQYAFDAIENKYKLAEWHQQDVRVILRFVMDYSTDRRHKDIPDWLYDEIKRDGIWYDEEVGKGFSPNYDNEQLIERHGQAIRALGQRYNHDPRVAFIALGSLGHWGEWHTYSNDKISIPFPKLATSDRYAEQYAEAFPDKHVLMRRPHPIAKDKGLGLFNDVFGSPRATADFVDWFENGYFSSLAGGVQMPAMPDFWRQAPSGGEFANAGRVRSYLQNDQIGQVLQMLERSHVSWLGPSNPADLELNEAERGNLDKLLLKMGYRLRMESVSFPETAVQSGEAKVSLEVVNEGVAPFYYNWPIELTLTDEYDQVALRQGTSGIIQSWQPGKSYSDIILTVPPNFGEGVYRMWMSVLDPATQKPGVSLAMEGRQADGRYWLGEMRIRKQTAAERIRGWLSGLSRSIF